MLRIRVAIALWRNPNLRAEAWPYLTGRLTPWETELLSDLWRHDR